jgi:L,D-peptidoglycan transpeptidase YkuD (ErfK/YbiS/YcfS/YnhG family)
MDRLSRGLARLAVAAALVVAGVAVPAPAQGASEVVLDGVTARLHAGTRQVVTVNHTSRHHARITWWSHVGGEWVRRLRSTDARIGYGGLVPGWAREQGTGTTPLGTYTLPFTFGTRYRQATWDMSYRRIRSHDYWVQDNRSRYYNRYRSRDLGGFRWWLDSSSVNSSERLADYGRQYEMSVVVGFNYVDPVRYRGAGIFLHVNGSGATAGCVSAPRWFISAVMARLDPDMIPVIAIGR